MFRRQDGSSCCPPNTRDPAPGTGSHVNRSKPAPSASNTCCIYQSKSTSEEKEDGEGGVAAVQGGGRSCGASRSRQRWRERRGWGVFVAKGEMGSVLKIAKPRDRRDSKEARETEREKERRESAQCSNQVQCD